MDLGETLEIKAMKEMGVGHMIGRLEVITEGMVEAPVTIGQGQVQEQVQIGIGLDVLNAQDMIISHETAQQYMCTER